jgi:hypothetical protein
MIKSALFRLSLRYGAVAGILAVVLLILLYYFGRNPFLISPFLDFRIFIFGIFIFFSLKEFRDYCQERILYFWQGLFGGFVVVVLASAISATGLWIFGTLEEGFVTSYVEGMTAYLKTFPKEEIERIGKDIYERNLKELPSTNIATLVFTHFVQGMIIGFFITIILSVIVRRTNQNL